MLAGLIRCYIIASKCTVLHTASTDKRTDIVSNHTANYVLRVGKSVTDITYDNKFKFALHVDKIYAKLYSVES